MELAMRSASAKSRAARLLADAENIAQSISDESAKARALGDVAAAMAATDPDRAERIAQSITSPYMRTLALLKIANV